MKYRLLTLQALLCILLSAEQAAATLTRLESVGRTYPMEGRDIVQELKERAGQIDLLVMQQVPQHYQPANLHALPRAEAERVFSVDPSYSLAQDITDSQRNLLYPQGFTFNPLHYAGLRGELVILDGSDSEQLAWFKASTYARDRRTILLLSGGFAAEVQEALQRPVYYLSHDMAARLGLRAVPAVISQAKNILTVREVRLAPSP